MKKLFWFGFAFSFVMAYTAGCGKSSQGTLQSSTGTGTSTSTSTGVANCDPSNPFGGGDGSSANPYKISNPCHLQNLGLSATNLSAHFVLTQDIDLSASQLDTTIDFGGVFDGQGHKIQNWTTFAPLFNSNSGTIQNLNVTNISMDRALGTGGGRAGLLVGQNNSGANITNCSASGAITNAYFFVGGLVGMNYGNITHSNANVSVNAQAGAGGLVGYNDSGTIMSSFSLGTIVAPRSGAPLQSGGLNNDGAGGLVGTNTGTIQNCYSLASATGQNQVGGLIGYNTGTVVNSFSAGSASGSSLVGGLIGAASGGAITSSYWDQTRSGQTTSAGGTAETTAQMQAQSTYAGWDFSSIWVAPMAGYPTLH